MGKVAVVYWTGSGNTGAMADAVAEGVRAAGNEAELFEASGFEASMVEGFDGFAFGCPAMGAEELEGAEFEPMFEECVDELGEKPIVLFGSYGWGDGEWMVSWKEDCEADDLNVVDTLIVNDAPDDEGVELCQKLGKSIL